VDIVTIDFETYYDKEYSLSKMTTEKYIRDPRFEVIGVGVKINSHEADYYSGSDPETFLRSLDYRDKAILCHNTSFDGAILSWKYGIKPKLWLDTLSMARPFHGLDVGGSLKALADHYGIGQKGNEIVNTLGKRREDFSGVEMARFAEYCLQDVNLTYKLFKILAKGFPPQEIMVIDQLLRMYTEPRIELDSELLQSHYDDVKSAQERLLSEVGVDRKELSSNPKFADLLTRLGVEPPTKISPRTGKTAYAFAKTDQGLLKLLEHEDPRVQGLVSARLGTKSTIEETRTLNLIEVSQRGNLPVKLNYYGAHTGRFSGGDGLNMQNLPARSNNKIRRSLRAPKGCVLIACDLAQIEARMLAWAAEQLDLVQSFREARDVYSEFATEVYGYPVTKANKAERFVGKTCILGLGYGVGAVKLRETLKLGQGDISVEVDENEAKRIVMLYRQKNHKVVRLWKMCDYVLGQIMTGQSGELCPSVTYDANGIRLPSGFYIRYPQLTRRTNGYSYLNKPTLVNKYNNGEDISDKNWTHVYGGKVTENLIQALASCVIREHMLNIGKQYPVVLQVHDEIVVTVPASEAETAEKFIVDVMSTPPAWCADLPVACESSVADNYGDCK
jgi:DNA polymerase I-like protein with 3'-5' exonuclease and polymerase domains